MASNGNSRRPPQSSTEKQEEENFQFSKVFQAFTELPRIIRLVWSTSALLTTTMAVISLINGFLPALSVWITGGLVDSVVQAAFNPTHSLTQVWFFVAAQLITGVAQSLLSTLSNI